MAENGTINMARVVPEAENLLPCLRLLKNQVRVVDKIKLILSAFIC